MLIINYLHKKLCLTKFCRTCIIASALFVALLYSLRLKEQPIERFSRLIDLMEFEFTINTRPCDERQLLLVLVHSAPDHFAERQTIRNTWGQKTGEYGDLFKLAFLLGGVDSAESQGLIDGESSAHADIIQGNFRDAYRNMTYKYAMGLKWTKYYCSSADFFLKTDDDVFVNTRFLLKRMSRLTYDLERDRTLYCNICRKCYTIRGKESKWYVSFEEYRHKFYPPYCFGFVVLSTPTVALRLYNETQSNPYWWIDDVYVTGILAKKANLLHHDLGEYTLDRPKLNEIRENATIDEPSFLFGPPQMNTSEIENLWRLVENSARKNRFD